MRRLLPALLVLLALAGCSRLRPLAPLSADHSDESNSTLKIEVRSARTSADLEPVKGWYGNESIPARLYVVAKITNNSGKLVVLPGFSHGSPSAFQFSCASPNARQPPFYISDNGQIEWIFLKPGESVHGVDNVGLHIAFLRSGSYDVEYQYRVGYAYATGPPVGLDEAARLYHRDHQAVAQGIVKIDVSPSDVYSGSWKP